MFKNSVRIRLITSDFDLEFSSTIIAIFLDKNISETYAKANRSADTGQHCANEILFFLFQREHPNHTGDTHSAA